VQTQNMVVVVIVVAVVVVMMMVMNGVCFKLHFCMCRVVRTSAESAPYRSATPPIPFEPIIVLRHSVHFTYPFIILHSLSPDSVIPHLHISLSNSFLLMASPAPIHFFSHPGKVKMFIHIF